MAAISKKQLIFTLLVILLGKSSLVIANEDDDIDSLQPKLGNEWVLVKDNRRSDIKVWIKQEDGKRFRSFKVEATVKVTMKDFIRASLDVESYPRWYWEVSKSRLIRKVSPTEYQVYVQHRAPHGMPDRDVATVIQISPQTLTNPVMTIQVKAIQGLVATKPPLVRMIAEDMLVKVTPVGHQKIHYVAEGYVDPGGVVPIWAYNSIQRIAPYQVVLGLKRFLETQKDSISPIEIPFFVREFEDLK